MPGIDALQLYLLGVVMVLSVNLPLSAQTNPDY